MSLVQDAIMCQMAAAEPWDDSAMLYKPNEEKQILLSENGSCLSVQAYIYMCGLNVEVISQSNAEFMSPSGLLPVLKCGKFVISEPTSIFNFIKQKGVSLNPNLDDENKNDMVAYIELVNDFLLPAEFFVTWMHSDTIKEITWKRYGNPYPWPLNHLLCWRKQQNVKAYLTAIGWGKGQKSFSTVEEEVKRCCHALSQKLGEKLYFFGDKPTELDALVFGHLFTLLTTMLPDNRLAECIQEFKNLVSFCQHIDKTYFRHKSEASSLRHSSTD